MTYKPTRAPATPKRAAEAANETVLVANLIKHMRKIPRCHARKVHGSMHQDKGEPDIDAVLDGRAVKVEVKMPGKTPTPIQYKRLRDWQAVGALVGWVTCQAELDDLLSHVHDLQWVWPRPLWPGEVEPEVAPGRPRTQ